MQYRRVHAVAGSSAAGAVRIALDSPADEPVLPIEDCLSCGPLREFAGLDDWKSLRERFWRSLFREEDFPAASLLPDPAVLTSAESIVLWVGTGLAEQLTLAWFPQLLRTLGISVERVRIAQVPMLMGMCTPKAISEQGPPEPLSPADLDRTDAAWHAVTAPNPQSLIDQLEHGSSALPLLRQALQATPYRYPDRRSGISGWDRVLLANVRDHGPKMAYVMGHSISNEMGFSDPVGDHWLYWRARRHADVRLPSPLLCLHGNPFEYPGTTVELTAHGREVLEGRTNALELNGIDEEIFGVHLDSKSENVWVEDGGKIVPWSA